MIPSLSIPDNSGNHPCSRLADVYEVPAPDFCRANTRCSASSPGAQLTGGADFPVEAPPAFLSEIHHDHVHPFLLNAESNGTEAFAWNDKTIVARQQKWMRQ